MADPVIQTRNLGKQYRIWADAPARLKTPVLRRLARILPAGRLRDRVNRQVRHCERSFEALKPLDLDLHRGESLGIIGLNGSGKSTLLQLLAGTLTPSSGDLRVNGRVAALLELGSGFHPEFTGRENVYLNASILGLDRPTIEARFDAIAAFADIGDFLEQPVKTYSSGMVVRLAFAVMAHVDADILIIDEALAVGDMPFVQKCMRFIHRFRETGTLILVTHDTSAVQGLCDRVLWLDHGAVRGDGDPKTVTDDYLAFCFGQANQSAEAENGTVAADREDRPAEAVLEETQPEAADFRQDLLRRSDLRNDIEVLPYDPQGRAFGERRAEVVSVELTDPEGKNLSWVVGGEPVRLKVRIRARQETPRPILGFYVRNRHGQCLFGDNTSVAVADAGHHLYPDDHYIVVFAFRMPILENGEHAVSVALASGTMAEHRHQHWVHDALPLRSVNEKPWTGLVGVPMHRITCRVERPAGASTPRPS
ncbi:MAG: ABC transporter ATP-binding protein [Opitutales bacterium]